MHCEMRRKKYRYVLVAVFVFGLFVLNHLIRNEPERDLNVSYLNKYSIYTKCRSNLAGWAKEIAEQDPKQASFTERSHEYSRPASKQKLEERIIRAVIAHVHIDQLSNFEIHIKWLYNSWIEALKHEPPKWRTDLVLFTDADGGEYASIKNTSFLTKLNCTTLNRRTSELDAPMCSIIPIKPMILRRFDAFVIFQDYNSKYEYLLNDVDIFSDDPANLLPFYSFLKDAENYEYLESILIAFEGYQYFKQAGYDFLIRSDLDNLLTPLFGKWVPKHCNDFYVGHGNFSRPFNAKRLARVARDLGLDHAGLENLGSTWYSTPEQFRLVAYLTLFGIGYLSEEEFAPTEKDGSVGQNSWPDWHYRVAFLYAQSLMLDHLASTGQINLIRLASSIDHNVESDEYLQDKILLHVFREYYYYSAPKITYDIYNKIDVAKLDLSKVRDYALKLGFLARSLPAEDIVLELQRVVREFSKN